MRARRVSCPLAILLAAGCAATGARQAGEPLVADLASGEGFASLRAAFAAVNPGYDVDSVRGCHALPPVAAARVAFVQGPTGRTAAPTVGDLLLLRAGEAWRLDAGDAGGDEPGVDLVVFTVPQALPPELPATIRPDWDPRITDTPGGCAEDQKAYRRIELTWLPAVGPYVWHGLNAHRVRIDDSFSHYHPKDGGFDELYLVQSAPATAQLLTSTQVAAIEAEAVTRDQAKSLLRTRALARDQLVYLPRGTMHRGRGGAVVQVIAVPGFVPGTEVGIDHHLWAIDKALGLEGPDALPFHVVAARTAIVK